MPSDIPDILRQEGIRDFSKDIRTMTVYELRKNFAFEKSRKVNITNLIKNLIWQAYTWIKQGKMSPIEGNIRSFWYISVKPVLSRLRLNVSGCQYTEKVYDCFVEMVTGHRLFRYADFGFLDERIHARTVGKTNGNLILFVEKDGLFSLVKKIAMEHDATGIALGGFPSLLTTEYLINSMTQAGSAKQPIHLFSVVDYDPNGYWIEQEFTRQLKNFGLEVGSIHSLVQPQCLPGDLVEMCKYKLDKDTKTKNWLAITNGIAGKPFGLEADALGGQRIREAYEKALEPYLKPLDTALLAEKAAAAAELEAKRSLAPERLSLQNVEEIVEAIAALGIEDLGKLQKLFVKRMGISFR